MIDAVGGEHAVRVALAPTLRRTNSSNCRPTTPITPATSRLLHKTVEKDFTEPSVAW